MNEFDDLMLYLMDFSHRAKLAARAIAASEGHEDPIKEVEDELKIKVSGRLMGAVPLMDKESAELAQENPDVLGEMLKGEQLRDALGDYIAGDK